MAMRYTFDGRNLALAKEEMLRFLEKSKSEILAMIDTAGGATLELTASPLVDRVSATDAYKALEVTVRVRANAPTKIAPHGAKPA